jgi:DNA-binding MarR family transcriptional regulator
MSNRRIDAHRKARFLRPEEMDRSVALLMLAARGFEATARAGLPEGLTLTHRLMLLLIKSGTATTAGELQTLLGLPKQTVSRHVHQLIEAGYVARRAADGDRRRKLLVMTAAGAELCDRLDRTQRRRLGSVFRTHGPETVANFETVLLDLVEPRARPFFDEETLS